MISFQENRFLTILLNMVRLTDQRSGAIITREVISLEILEKSHKILCNQGIYLHREISHLKLDLACKKDFS